MIGKLIRTYILAIKYWVQGVASHCGAGLGNAYQGKDFSVAGQCVAGQCQAGQGEDFSQAQICRARLCMAMLGIARQGKARISK